MTDPNPHETGSNVAQKSLEQHWCDPSSLYGGAFSVCKMCGALLRPTLSPEAPLSPFVRSCRVKPGRTSAGLVRDYFENLQRNQPPRSPDSLAELSQRQNARVEIVDACLKFSRHFGFDAQTHYLAISYINQMYHRYNPDNSKFQMLAATCLFLAAKKNEGRLRLPKLRFFFKAFGLQVSSRDFLASEYLVCTVLEFRLRPSTPYQFVSFFIELGLVCESELPGFSSEFCQRPQAPSCAEKLSLVFVEFCSRFFVFAAFRPLEVGLSCVVWARRLMGLSPWVPELGVLTGLTLDGIGPCLNLMLHQFCLRRKDNIRYLRDFINNMTDLPVKTSEPLFTFKIPPGSLDATSNASQQIIRRRRKIKKTKLKRTAWQLRNAISDLVDSMSSLHVQNSMPFISHSFDQSYGGLRTES